MSSKKWTQFVKIRGPKCGYANLIPVYEVFRIIEPTHCEKCGEIIVELEERKGD